MGRGSMALVAGLVIALGLAGCARAQGAPDPEPTQATGGRDYTASLHLGGLTRTYTTHLPPAASAGSPLPLVMALHGRLGTGAGKARLSNFNAVADAAGFIVVYPNGYRGGGHTWPGGLRYPPAAGVGKTSRNLDASQVIWQLFQSYHR